MVDIFENEKISNESHLSWPSGLTGLGLDGSGSAPPALPASTRAARTLSALAAR